MKLLLQQRVELVLDSGEGQAILLTEVSQHLVAGRQFCAQDLQELILCDPSIQDLLYGDGTIDQRFFACFIRNGCSIPLTCSGA